MEFLPEEKLVRGTELDYAKYNTVHGSYQLTQLIQQSGGQNVGGSANGLQTTGGQESIFELPPKVYNFSKFILKYTNTVTSNTNGGNVIFNDTVAEIKQIQLYTRGGLFLVDIPFLNNYVDMVLKPSTKYESLVSNDDVNPGFAGVWEGLQQCPQSITAGGVATYNNVTVPANTVSATNNTTVSTVSVMSSINAPQYAIIGAVATGTNNTYTRQIPFTIFKDTMLALDKNVYFGGETMYLKIIWDSANKYAYNTNTANNPGGTGIAGNVTGLTALATNPTLNNLILYAAIEQNQVIQQEVMSKVNSGQFNIAVPFVWSSKWNISGQAQTVTVRYNRGHGNHLKKIWIAPYNASETLNTAYDHSNIAQGNATPGSKINNFYTLVNNVRTTQFNMYCPNYDDYLNIQKKLQGSCIVNSIEYYTNYFWLEDFTNNLSVLDKQNSPSEDNQIDGIPMGQDDIIYQYFANLPANATLNWYVYAVTQRMLSIAPNGLIQWT